MGGNQVKINFLIFFQNRKFDSVFFKYWMMSKTGEIRRDEVCLDYSDNKSNRYKNDKIITFKCHGQEGNQKWYFEDGLIRHNSDYCIEVDPVNRKLFMNECDVQNDHQKWEWKINVKTASKKPMLPKFNESSLA
jgi:hypothetical protein